MVAVNVTQVEDWERKPGMVMKRLCLRWCCGLAIIALLATGCVLRKQPEAPAPTQYVYQEPEEDITTAIRFTHEDWVSYFGFSVDIYNDVLVAGAPRWNTFGESAGSADVFRKSTDGEWRKETTLVASDRDDGFQYDMYFGETVAIHGNVIAAGAPGYDDPEVGDNTGAVYIFEYDGGSWVETGKLLPGNRTPGGRVGKTLSFDGEMLVVSGYPASPGIYVFRYTEGSWIETAEITAPPSPDGEPNYIIVDHYGDTLALSTVTMPPEDGKWELVDLKRTGMVTLYERSGEQWRQTFQTDPQDAGLYPMFSERQFGLHISLGGAAGKATLLAVGRPGFPESGIERGSVVIYARGEEGWTQQAELRLADGYDVPSALRLGQQEVGAIYFGAFVDFEDKRLAVISTFADAVYVFEQQGSDWVYQTRFSPNLGDDFMRRVVAMSDQNLVLGASGELGGGNIYIFSFDQ
jgi:hypothetical protein